MFLEAKHKQKDPSIQDVVTKTHRCRSGLFWLLLLVQNSLVKRWIKRIEILFIQSVGGQAERFSETAELNEATETPFPPLFHGFASRKKASRSFFESGLLFCVFNYL